MLLRDPVMKLPSSAVQKLQDISILVVKYCGILYTPAEILLNT